MMGILKTMSEWSGYPLDCYDYKSTCGAKNAMTSSRVHSLCLHEEHFRLTPVPEEKEELESRRDGALLLEKAKSCVSKWIYPFVFE